MEDLTIKVNGKEYNVKVEETEDGKILVHLNGDVFVDDSNKATPLTGLGSNVTLWQSGDAVINGTRLEAIAHVVVGGVTETCQAGINVMESDNVCGFRV